MSPSSVAIGASGTPADVRGVEVREMEREKVG